MGYKKFNWSSQVAFVYMYSDMLSFFLMIVYIKLKGEVHNWSNFYVLTYQVYYFSVAPEIHKNVLYHGQFLWLFYIKKQFFCQRQQ